MANIAKVGMLGKKDNYYAWHPKTDSFTFCEKFSFQALCNRHFRSLSKANQQRFRRQSGCFFKI